MVSVIGEDVITIGFANWSLNYRHVGDEWYLIDRRDEDQLLSEW